MNLLLVLLKLMFGYMFYRLNNLNDLIISSDFRTMHNVTKFKKKNFKQIFSPGSLNTGIFKYSSSRSENLVVTDWEGQGVTCTVRWWGEGVEAFGLAACITEE